MADLTKTVTQTKPYQPYRPTGKRCYCDECKGLSPDSLSCADGDWTIHEPGHHGRPLCSKVDPYMCPVIGGNDGNAQFTDDPPEVACTYRASDFQNLDDIQTYVDTWGEDDQLNDAMTGFCKQQSVSCPIDPETGKQMPICSNLIATDDAGDICRDWAHNHPDKADQSKREYCAENDSADCRCLHRSDDDAYKAAKPYVPGVSDACWYNYCQDPSTYVTPSDMMGVECPAETCANIVRGVRRELDDHRENMRINVSKDELESKISCDFDADYPYPAPKDYDDSGWGYAGFLILLIIIILAIALYMYYVSTEHGDHHDEHPSWW